MTPPLPPVPPTPPLSWKKWIKRAARAVAVFVALSVAQRLLTSGDDVKDWLSVRAVHDLWVHLVGPDQESSSPQPPAPTSDETPTPTPTRTEETTSPASTPGGSSTSDGSGGLLTEVPAGGVADIDLGQSNGIHARAYFGPISAVLTAAPSATFRLFEPPEDPKRCALTVVFTDVHGTTATVSASGFDYETDAWTSPEWTPDSAVSRDGGVVHEQLLQTPANLAPGYAVTGYAVLDIDGASAPTSGQYSMSLIDVQDGLQVWAFNGFTVRCAAGPTV